VVLASTDPVIWRRIQVPTDYSFWDLHVAMQDAMGWQDYHLHEFTVLDGRRNTLVRLGIPDDAGPEVPLTIADWTVPLAWYTDVTVLPFLYTYDFGDDWQHVVAYEGTWPTAPRRKYPRCLGGARACPPEDSGGAHRYQEMLLALGDAKHPEHDAFTAWLGGHFDPDAFSPATCSFDDPRARWNRAFGNRAV